MIQGSILPLAIILCSLIPGILIFFLSEANYRWRTLLNLTGAVLKLVLVIVMIQYVLAGQYVEFRLTLLPGMDLVLRTDTLSILFTTLSAVLWLFTTIYAIGYLEGSPNRSRFFSFFSLCVSATMGIAMSGNMITFLFFYEALTLATYPLVIHRGTPRAVRAGRVYLAYTLSGGVILLIAIAWLRSIAGPLEFTETGFLAARDDLNILHLQIIFALLIIGLGVKAALFPLHGWLPIAMIAPAPVSALLHAVAVVKAGAFGIIRVVYDVYGITYAEQLGLLTPLALLAALTILYGSVMALRQNNLKRRLAYSTVSQVSYITLGVAIFGPIASLGGIVHLVHQGIMKITLFFCAGNLAETLNIHKVSELNGIGRRMPLTMALFTIAALGMIGLPPLAGFISKWYLGLGALAVDKPWVLLVLAISTLLNAAYFLPVLYRAWFLPAARDWPKSPLRLETHWMLLLPPLVTAVLSVAVGLFAQSLFSPLSWTELIVIREYLQP